MKKELLLQLIELAASGETTPQAATPSPEKPHPMTGKNVLIRARNAGVHYGTLESADTGFINLTNANRIWNWEGAFTLSEVSQKGITKGRIAMTVPKLSIPTCDVAEIITLNEKARESLSGHIEN